MKTHTLSALTLVAAVLPLAAQTPATKPAIHHTTVTTGCAKLPEISSKIPAVPAGTPCPKVLYTVTKLSESRLDYASPLVSPELKAALGGAPTTYSLIYTDTKIGTGELAKPGKFYTVHYTGYLAADGSKFDSSVDRGDPITFPYGGHRVIPGWDTGFEGMKVGGKRRLFIPYQLAYGEAGHPPVIPAKSMLVFDVEFIAQGDTQPAPKPKPVLNKPATSADRPAPSASPAPPPPAAAPPVASPAPAKTTASPNDTVGGVVHATPAPATTAAPQATAPTTSPQQ